MTRAESMSRWRALFAMTLRERPDGRAAALLANSGWLIFERLVRALLGLLVGAWVARHLGPAEYGALAYVLAFVALFQAIAALGADGIVVRDVAQKPETTAQILGCALMLRLGLGVLCWLGVVAAAAVLANGDSRMVWMSAVAGGVLVFQAADVVDLWFQSQTQSRRTVQAKLTACLLSTGIKVALILAGAPLVAFAAVTTIEAAGTALALYIAYRRFPATQRWRPSLQVARAMLREAWPFMLSGLAIMVYMRVDQIMIQRLLGARELGIYAAILPLSQLWQVVPMAAATTLLPLIARQRLNDEAAYRATLVRVFRAFFYAGLACAVLTWAFSALLVAQLFGPAYIEGAKVLAIHSFSNVFLFLGVGHGLWLTNERRFSVRLIGTLLAGLSTVGLNFLLLPRIGLTGAAWASVWAQCVAAFLINALLDRRSFRMQLDAIFFRKV